MTVVATPSTPHKAPAASAEEKLQTKLEDLMYGFAAPMFRPAPPIRRETSKHIVQSAMYPLNELADEYFYNVGEDDKAAVHDQVKQTGVVTAGSVVFVAPGEAPLFFPDVYAFLAGHHKYADKGPQDWNKKVRALCVPGVGSSVLGAVGLARDVATARKVPVAGVVTGYGLRELFVDAFGGAFFFRGINELFLAFEEMRRSLPGVVAGYGLLPCIETYDSLAGGPAIQAVKALLRDGRLPNLEFVIGHSKGNLVLSGALGELVCENEEIEKLRKVTVVLLSAICSVPELGGREPIQIIGALDGLGLINSRLSIRPTKIVPNAMHHLNRSFPFHLDAISELASL